MRLALSAAVLLAAAPSARAQVADDPGRIYAAAADSVVGVRAVAPLGERSGTGAVLSADGLILTSYAVVPEGARAVRVWRHGPRLLRAEVVAVDRDLELTLLRVNLQDEPPLKPIEWGDPESAGIGDPAYTIGNASNSIINNNAPSFHAGILSGRYRLSEPRGRSTYAGPVLETTAAVTVGMDGAPLLDGRGRMIGMVCLTYSPHRFLGAAIPAHLIRPAIDRLRSPDPGARQDAESAETEVGYLGLKVRDSDGRVIIQSVDADSPASRAGLAPGVIVRAVGSATIKSARDFVERTQNLKAGTVLFLRVDDGAGEIEVKIQLERKK